MRAQRLNFDAISLEAVYQIMKTRGYKGTRWAFRRLAGGMVFAIAARGEIRELDP